MAIIFLSDLHLSERKPVNRTDDNWIDTCISKLEQVFDYAREKKIVHIVIAGDFFDRSSHSPELVNRVLNLLAINFDRIVHIVPGNHDMLNHNQDLIHKSQIETINICQCVDLKKKKSSFPIDGFKVDFFPFGSELKYEGGDIAVIHELAYKNKPWDKAPEGGNFKRIIKKMAGYKLIVAGDNHEDFIDEFKGCKFINCGGMLRKGIHEAGREPKFYVVNKNLKIKPVKFKIKENVFDFDKANLIKKKNSAIEEAANSLAEDLIVDLDFRKTMKRALSEDSVSEEVRSIVEVELENI